jgi:hypothetical protein
MKPFDIVHISFEVAPPGSEINRYLHAARVPESLQPHRFGPWTIERRQAENSVVRYQIGWSDYTLLWRESWRTLHLPGPGEIVMEDSHHELARHLPIWLNARGRVLVTGLGLGCVVRGLLANPAVTHIDVVEIDPDIIRVVWPEFQREERCLIREGDALNMTWPPGTFWDYAWHDLWTDRPAAVAQ